MLFLLLALSLAPTRIQAQTPIPAGHARVLAQFVDESGVSIPDVRVSRGFGDEFFGQSDSNGRFAADIPCEGRTKMIHCFAVARAFGYAAAHPRLDVWEGHEEDLGRVVLAPGGAISGRVVDVEGRPLAGAQVRAHELAEYGPPGSVECEAPRQVLLGQARTDADGRYRIVGVVGRVHVWIQYEGTWARWLEDAVDVGAREEVRLPDEMLVARPSKYRIEGVVLDENGLPVPGVGADSAITDAKGRFVLHLLQVDDDGHDLSISPPGEAFADAEVSNVPAGKRDLVVRLSSLRTLEVAVMDEDCEPVERFVIRDAQSGSGEGPHRGGRVTLHVPQVPFSLAVDAPGYLKKDLGVFGREALPRVVEVVLERAPAVSGVVTFEGLPVEGAVVEWVCGQASSLWKFLPDRRSGPPDRRNGPFHATGDHVVTDALGRFELPCLDEPTRPDDRIRARVEGLCAALSDPLPQAERAGIVLSLLRGGTVAGSVQLPGGRPHASLDVEFYRERFVFGDDKGPPVRARVDANGEFRMGRLDSGAWLVSLIPSGTLVSDMGWAREQVAELREVAWVVEVEEGGTARLDLDLAKPERLCRLVGRLGWAGHQQQGGVELLLDGPLELKVAGAKLESDGRFELEVRCPGTYRIVVREGGHTVTDLVALSAGENTWSYDLPSESLKGDIRLDH